MNEAELVALRGLAAVVGRVAHPVDEQAGDVVLPLRARLEDLRLAARVAISRGPLVEGTFVAAVQASAGDGLEGVRAAADEAASMDKLGDR